MDLREDKHWTYGALTMLANARGQRLFLAWAPVQTDKTKESMAEIDKDLRGILADHPATDAELARVKASETLRLPGSRETIDRVMSSIGDLVEYDLPEDYYQTTPEKCARWRWPISKRPPRSGSSGSSDLGSGG